MTNDTTNIQDTAIDNSAVDSNEGDFSIRNARWDKVIIHFPRFLQIHHHEPMLVNALVGALLTGENRVFEGDSRFHRPDIGRYVLRTPKGAYLFEAKLTFSMRQTLTIVQAEIQCNFTRYAAHMQARENCTLESSNAEKLALNGEVSASIKRQTLTNSDNFVEEISCEDFLRCANDYINSITSFIAEQFLKEDIASVRSNFFERNPDITLDDPEVICHMMDGEPTHGNGIMDFDFRNYRVSYMEVYWEKHQPNAATFINRNEELLRDMLLNASVNSYTPSFSSNTLSLRRSSEHNTQSITSTIFKNHELSLYAKTPDKVRIESRYKGKNLRNFIGAGELRSFADGDTGVLSLLILATSRAHQRLHPYFRYLEELSEQIGASTLNPEKAMEFFYMVGKATYPETIKQEFLRAIWANGSFVYLNRGSDTDRFIQSLVRKRLVRKASLARNSRRGYRYVPRDEYATAIEALRSLPH